VPEMPVQEGRDPRTAGTLLRGRDAPVSRGIGVRTGNFSRLPWIGLPGRRAALGVATHRSDEPTRQVQMQMTG